MTRREPAWPKQAVRVLDGDGKPAMTIPVKDGMIELPPTFFRGNPTCLKLDWIDFYR